MGRSGRNLLTSEYIKSRGDINTARVLGRGEAFGQQFIAETLDFLLRLLRPYRVQICLTEQYWGRYYLAPKDYI